MSRDRCHERPKIHVKPTDDSNFGSILYVGDKRRNASISTSASLYGLSLPKSRNRARSCGRADSNGGDIGARRDHYHRRNRRRGLHTDEARERLVSCGMLAAQHAHIPRDFSLAAKPHR